MEWCTLNSSAATPYHPRDLRQHAYNISGKLPGKNWHYRFLSSHNEELKLGKPRQLDPKRAQNFNEENIKHYFNLRQEVEDKYGPIPPEHHWNMDEKGGQHGGGRKGDGQKFIFSRQEADSSYRQHSDNLELVTIIECASAAGHIIRDERWTIPRSQRRTRAVFWSCGVCHFQTK